MGQDNNDKDDDGEDDDNIDHFAGGVAHGVSSDLIGATGEAPERSNIDPETHQRLCQIQN
jgi:hypothetical protein